MLVLHLSLCEELLEVFDGYRIESCEELVLVVGQRVSRECMVELVLDRLDATEDAARTAAQVGFSKCLPECPVVELEVVGDSKEVFDVAVPWQ